MDIHTKDNEKKASKKFKKEYSLVEMDDVNDNDREQLNSQEEKVINNNSQEIVKNNCQNRSKKFLKCLSIPAFILVYLLYFLSLEGCFEGQDVCVLNVKWMAKNVIQEEISCVTMAILVQLMIFKKISKLHLIHFIIVFASFYIYSHGLDFPDHGYFNFILYFIELGLLTLIFICINFIIICLSKLKNKLTIIIFFLLMIILFCYIYYVFINVLSNCEEWDKGLNNTYINHDDKYGCHLVYPKVCAYKVLDYLQDYTSIRRKDCSSVNQKNAKENLLQNSKSPYINDYNKINRIGYPLTNKDPSCFLDFIYSNNTLSQYFDNNLVDMDNEKILNEFFKDKKPEIEVDFTDKEHGKLVINVNYNKTLSQERKLMEKKSNPYSDNILIIYIDSLSRNTAFRKMPKTLKFFEKFMSYKGGFHEHYPKEIYHSFQFFKFFAFYGYTSVNYPLFFYGQKAENRNKTLITKYLKENGYITSNAHDHCSIDNIRCSHNFTIDEVYDHQFIMCDPNNEFISINTIRCLYGKQNIEYLYDYTEQFWRKYINNRKYSIIISNHAHEGTLSVPKYIDELTFNFLNNLFNDNLFKDSTIILLSDHGVGLPSVYYLFDFYLLERHLPTLYMIINDRKNISYEEQYGNIYENQQKFITPFDVYNTLGNIIYGDNYKYISNNTNYNNTLKSEYGLSLFDNINVKGRTTMEYNKIILCDIFACL